MSRRRNVRTATIIAILAVVTATSCRSVTPATGELTIALITPDGQRMPGYFVTVHSAVHRSQTLPADGQGEATFTLPAGDWRVYVETGALEQVTRPTIVVMPDTAQRVAVTLDPRIDCIFRP